MTEFFITRSKRPAYFAAHPANREFRKSTMCRFFSMQKMLYQKGSAPANSAIPPGNGADEELAQRVVQIIEKSYRDTLSLQALADRCHISPFHLRRTFKRIKGVSPAEYILQKRIEKAVDLLAHSERSIAEIASMVGIANAEYFASLFKKKTGQSPTSYRQMKRR